jgi:drug/metabolite transporter (DMT)-like permease
MFKAIMKKKVNPLDAGFFFLFFCGAFSFIQLIIELIIEPDVFANESFHSYIANLIMG